MAIPLLNLREQYLPMEAEILAEVKEIFRNQAFILGEKVEKLPQIIVLNKIDYFRNP